MEIRYENCTKDVENVHSAILDAHEFFKKFGIIYFDLFGVGRWRSSEGGCDGYGDDDYDDYDDDNNNNNK